MSTENTFWAVAEAMVDNQGLSTTLYSLASICGEKADHIRASYSDARLAAQWDAAAGKIRATADKLAHLG